MHIYIIIIYIYIESTSVYLHMCLSLSLSLCIALFVASFCLSFLLIPFTYTCILHIYIYAYLHVAGKVPGFLLRSKVELHVLEGIRVSGSNVGCGVQSFVSMVSGLGFWGRVCLWAWVLRFR